MNRGAPKPFQLSPQQEFGGADKVEVFEPFYGWLDGVIVGMEVKHGDETIAEAYWRPVPDYVRYDVEISGMRTPQVRVINGTIIASKEAGGRLPWVISVDAAERRIRTKFTG